MITFRVTIDRGGDNGIETRHYECDGMNSDIAWVRFIRASGIVSGEAGQASGNLIAQIPRERIIAIERMED